MGYMCCTERLVTTSRHTIIFQAAKQVLALIWTSPPSPAREEKGMASAGQPDCRVERSQQEISVIAARDCALISTHTHSLTRSLTHLRFHYCLARFSFILVD